MKTIYITLVCFALALCSCTQYPYKGSYLLAESYPSAKSKLDQYYGQQKKGFTLFQDQITPIIQETAPGNKTSYSLTRWAPDIGSQLLHEASLSRTGATTSRFEVGASGSLYWGASTADRVEDIDEWVVANLKVRRREFGEQRP